MKLSEMKQILDAQHIQLTKSLGQSFLHDANQLRRIADAAQLTGSDHVLEIGPGLGPLTELLLARAQHVLALETDARLVRVLQERFAKALKESPPSPGRLELIHADALQFIRRSPRDWGSWKVVSNLPYSVASPILVDLAQAAASPSLMVVTVQLEVARRLMAGPGTSDYGLLSLLVQLRYQPAGFFKIPASCFFPEPAVDSACLELRLRPDATRAVAQLKTFAKVAKRAFSQRRKMMLKLLKQDWPAEQLEQGFARASIPANARAESVSLGQFIQLSSTLQQSSAPSATLNFHD